MEACFADDLDALLAIHRVRVRHRIRVRTTYLAERSFVEERRRTKVIGRFPSRCLGGPAFFDDPDLNAFCRCPPGWPSGLR
jgi:hypothetical protein